jgi:site-specific recombinase XerD
VPACAGAITSRASPPVFAHFRSRPHRLRPGPPNHGAEIARCLSHHEGGFPSLNPSSGAYHDSPASANDRRHDPSRAQAQDHHGLRRLRRTLRPTLRQVSEVLGTAEIRSYLLCLTHNRHVASNTYNQALCTLKFLYRFTLRKEWGLDRLGRTRRQTKLPVVWSLDEVTRFFQAITSLCHRAILMTAYAAGRRISEVPAPHIGDFDSQRMVIRIDQGKGSKDRYVMLSPRLLALLREYWKAHRRRKVYRRSPWLFPGNVPNGPLTDKPVYEACEEACRSAGLGKHVTVHTLGNASAYYTTFRRMAYFQGNSCCPGVRFRSWRPAWTASTAA